ncbi:MAG: DUF202 domain-containing protein [bacterium]
MPKKEKNPYTKYLQKELILRDQLAIDRTILANERTLLSYYGTGITLLVSSITLIKFFEFLLIEIAGFCLIPLSLLCMIVGYKRYVTMRSQIFTISTQSHILHAQQDNPTNR